MRLALEIDNLTKRFGALTAVDGLSLRLEQGTLLGLLGRNGAGKSTTINMATGLLNPTSGSIRVLGFTALQAAVCVGPLLLVYRPDAAEVVGGLAAAGTILVAVNAGGHLLAIRFPRPVSSGGTSTLPIYLSWIPGLAMLALSSVIVIAHAAIEGLGRWAAPAVFALMLAAAMTAYCRALPATEAVLVRNRERLIGM